MLSPRPKKHMISYKDVLKNLEDKLKEKTRLDSIEIQNVPQMVSFHKQIVTKRIFKLIISITLSQSKVCKQNNLVYTFLNNKTNISNSFKAKQLKVYILSSTIRHTLLITISPIKLIILLTLLIKSH